MGWGGTSTKELTLFFFISYQNKVHIAVAGELTTASAFRVHKSSNIKAIRLLESIRQPPVVTAGHLSPYKASQQVSKLHLSQPTWQKHH